MKVDCSIIKDLLPSYIENLISDETKQYIDDHIHECTECKQLLMDMQGDNFKELNRNLEKEAEKGSIRIIKKHRRISFALKIISIVLINIILISSICLTIKFKPINSVISKVHNKLQELKELNNYKLTIEKTANVLNGITEIETTTYYYKDGKYKEECKMDFTIYYKNGEFIEEGLKQNGEYKVLYYSDRNSNIDKEIKNIEKGQIIEELYPSMKQYSKDVPSKISMMQSFDLREDTYNNESYYILTKVYDEVKTSYEYWINKETLMIDRKLCKQENSSYADEKYRYNIYNYKYTIQPNIVTDKDVITQ